MGVTTKKHRLLLLFSNYRRLTMERLDYKEYYIDEYEDMALMIAQLENLLIRIKKTRERIVVKILLEEIRRVDNEKKP
jgi:hypothetical protein